MTLCGSRWGFVVVMHWDRVERTTWAEQLRRDLDGMGLWEAWYLAMGREKFTEFATSLCCSCARYNVQGDHKKITH